MRKLLIVDPSLESLEGHSYNYDRAILGAAQGKQLPHDVGADVARAASDQYRPRRHKPRDCMGNLRRRRGRGPAWDLIIV